jgi:LuxR family maltose regulon positive regulatory protein
MLTGDGTAYGVTTDPPVGVGDVFESKLQPPPLRAEWIDRSLLMDRITEAVRLPVLLVAAPAGYGKSTVITQWVNTPATGTVAWVDLDPADNDPTRLWAQVAAALDRVGCQVAVAPEFVATSATAAHTRVLPRLVEALAAYPASLTVVLDDLQVIRHGECTEQLDYLISRLPDHVHLVLISRSDPLLRLGRLRVEGKLTEIRSADLAFAPDEVAAVLRGEGVALSDTTLRELVRQTEGWPAAVYLAALSLAGRADTDAFVRRLSGSNRQIADYLSEEVLTRLEPELHDFILTMSLFDGFNAELADHVTQSRSSARLLRLLERTNLFVVRLPLDDDWVRFHHLFATFARSSLEVEHPELVNVHHLRGAQWFAAHGQVEDAVHHLLAGDAHDEAATLIQANWLHFFDAGRSATVLGWLHVLRGTSADTGPAATVTAAWMAALTGEQDELRRRLQALESMADRMPLPDGTTSPQSALVLIRGLFGYDGPDKMLADARRAVELESIGSSPWHPVAQAALGYAAFVTGDVELARGSLNESARAPSAPATFRVLALGTLALCEAEQGRATLSAELAREAMDIVVGRGMQAMPEATFAATAYGAMLAAENRLDEAATVLDEALVARRRVPGLTPWPLVHHLITMAVVAARREDRTTAEELLDEVEALTTWTDQSMGRTRDRIAAARRLLGEFPGPRPDSVGEPLTPREQEILRRLHGSRSIREIATDLSVSHNTVKTITSSVYRKLGAHSRVEALAIARQRG